MAKFMVFYEGKPLNTYIIDEPVITIGRLPENTISIANMGVSRRHLRIEEDYDRNYVLTDLNSLNGTIVNGKRVKKVPLNSGDKITIGKFTIVYEEISTDTEIGQHLPMDAYSQQPHEQQQVSEDPKPPDTRAFVKTAVEPQKQPPEEQAPGSTTQKMAAAAEVHPVLIETAKHLIYKLDKQYITIGGGDTDDIPVTGFLVGEQQAFIERCPEGWRIGTAKMMSKLKINGHAKKSHLLQHKDRIDIGSTSFRFMENG